MFFCPESQHVFCWKGGTIPIVWAIYYKSYSLVSTEGRLRSWVSTEAWLVVNARSLNNNAWMSQEVRIKGDRISGLVHPKECPIYKQVKQLSMDFSGSFKGWDRWHSPSPNWQEKYHLYTTYSPCLLGGYMYATYHLLREPEKSIETTWDIQVFTHRIGLFSLHQWLIFMAFMWQ